MNVSANSGFGYSALLTRPGRALLAGAVMTCVSQLLSSCAGYVPGEKAYWDARIRDMCAKDGGVLVYEQVVVSKAQFDTMGKVGGYASISPRVALRGDDIVFWDESVSVLQDANPRVWRSEQTVRRRSDDKPVARIVRYSRVGGDLPTGISHESSFGCPEEKEILAQRERVFRIQRDTK